MMSKRNSEIGVQIIIEGKVWQRIASLREAGPNDRVYVLDSDSGSIRFGDGEHGRRPPTGASYQANYQFGGGQSGNTSAASFSGFFPGANHIDFLSITTQGTEIKFQQVRRKLTWRRWVAKRLCEWFMKFTK